ncbi:hypothetical protein ACA910_004959 [Epithemia clementina (nom. ined.)]
MAPLNSTISGSTPVLGDSITKPYSTPETNKETADSGAFEACFVSGLDLSEFGPSTNSRTAGGTSASFQLLQVKEKEALRNEIQVVEEIRMQEVIQQRTEELKRSSQRATTVFAPTKKIFQQAQDLSTHLVKHDDNFLDALIESIHHDSRDSVNQSRASRQMEVHSRRMARKQSAKQKKNQLRLHSTLKGKVARKKEKSRAKY